MSTSSAPDPSPGLRLRLAGALSGVRRRVLLRRRGLAAVLVALAVLLALHDLRPPAARTVTVWTAAHDLTGGQQISADDVRRAAYPPATVPDGSVRDPATLLGRTLAGPVRGGTALTDLSVVGGALVSTDPERVVVPVRIADAGVVALLHVGDRVDLVAVDPDTSKEPTIVAAGARVLSLPGPGLTGSTTDQQGRIAVVSVLPQEAAAVAAAGVSGFLTVVLTP